MGEPPKTESAMCHTGYWMFRDRKKVEDTQATQTTQQRRAGVIDTLLRDANKQSEQTKPEETPVKEVAPAK
jgi:hypothetical protein